ncbi:Cro/CI family transcriptional regulator [Microbulbifer sp. TYP-18]|uniref:Cro/CI family transcriptional regulator n=1 Tax=Microbulbifer sp. TYP-18 TaxID=3230024 RepID=UPI0034C63450
MTKEQAIGFFGSPSALAKSLNITPQSVSQWASIPAYRQFQIALLSSGSLKPDEELLPPEKNIATNTHGHRVQSVAEYKDSKAAEIPA